MSSMEGRANHMAVSGGGVQSPQSTTSFLEELARQECKDMPCTEHQHCNHDNNINGEVDNNINDVEGRKEERRRFKLLDFVDVDDDLSDNSTDDYFSSSEEEEEDDEQDLDVDDAEVEEELHDEGEDDNNNGNNDLHQQQEGGDEEEILSDSDSDSGSNNNAVEEINIQQQPPQRDVKNASASKTSQTNKAAAKHISMLHSLMDPSSPYLNYERISTLLSSLANSEEVPLIRSDIPWSVLVSIGSTFTKIYDQDRPYSQRGKMKSILTTLYKNPNDPNGAKLLQGVLRMDPPLDAVKVILDAFPLSCLDMEGFFTACQFAHPSTSQRRQRRWYQSFKEKMLFDGKRLSSSGQDEEDPSPPQGDANKDKFNLESHQNDLSDMDDSDHDDSEDHDDASFGSSSDDVGQVVKLVMHKTVQARRLNSIDWGMVAFLGDARISPPQAKVLLRNAPEALTDPKHGAFGVSPLDRMASGFFIHGETIAWVKKLCSALQVAAFVRVKREERKKVRGASTSFSSSSMSASSSSSCCSSSASSSASSSSTEIVLPRGFFITESSKFDTTHQFNYITPPQSFYPYHELIRLLVSPKFRGNRFGKHGFLRTLRACTQADPDAFLRPDHEGNLPIHIALQAECKTVLGIKGERLLMKYLLDLDKNTSLCPEGISRRDGNDRRMPLRLSVENAWPAYDLIICAALSCCDTPSSLGRLDSTLSYKDDNNSEHNYRDDIAANMVLDRPLLHDVLNGCYHPRFGIHGARQLVTNIIRKVTSYQEQQSQDIIDGGKHSLTDFVDTHGRTALHVALESKWPVYDLIVQANPNFCLDVVDPMTGLLPFQLAACTLKSPYPNTKRQTKKPSSSKQLHADTKSINAAIGKCDQVDEAELIEMSTVFELIRESPLCVTWSVPNGCESKTRSVTTKRVRSSH